MNAEIKKTIHEGLKLYEASVKRMQTSKPQFASVFEAELKQITAARAAVDTVPETK